MFTKVPMQKKRLNQILIFTLATFIVLVLHPLTHAIEKIDDSGHCPHTKFLKEHTPELEFDEITINFINHLIIYVEDNYTYHYDKTLYRVLNKSPPEK